MTGTAMDLVLNANNLVLDFVPVIAAEQCNRATALPDGADFSCCIHRLLLTGAACLGEERLLLQETILGGSWGVLHQQRRNRSAWVGASAGPPMALPGAPVYVVV